MATDKLGLYIHIPYCKRKCNYCDFCSLPSNNGGVPREYVDRIIDEIFAYKEDIKPRLYTVYFGGGTPSLLEPSDIERIMLAIREIFDLSECTELTFEANPGTLNEAKVKGFRAVGFNRVSLGLQSIHEIEMKKLGRIHNYEEFLSSFKLLREAGFDNINVDLMFGIPYQTKESFTDTLNEVVQISPEHISCYGLMVEPGTPFGKEGDLLPLPSDDEECDMYYIASDILKKNGYSHYEISNFAKVGYESLHNRLYWNLDSYIGIGAAAHSYYKGIRRSNTSNVDEYICSQGLSPVDEYVLNIDDERYEFAMLALRLKGGFSLTEYEDRYGISFLHGKEKIIDNLIEMELVSLKDSRISLTEKGFYVSNSILIEIL